MIRKIHFCHFMIFFLMICYCCTSQEITEKGSENKKLKNLKPSFAGQFYPSDKIALEQTLGQLFSDAEPKTVNHVLGIIAPHAGYVFSGVVAASAYNQIDPEKAFENIFVIASSHRKYFDGASIYSIGHCETPLGEVKVNLELAQKLIDENKIFKYYPEAHLSEHSVEVQLPFLQYKLKKDFSIIPIVIGTQSKDDCRLIAKALLPYFNEDNLFVISSDFSHYPDFSNANRLDKITANVILGNDPQQFLDIIHSSENNKVPGVATLSCGWSAVLTLLYLTEADQNMHYSFIAYANSGESVYGDKARVVGYNAIAVSHKSEGLAIDQFNLSHEDKKNLLEIARATIEEFLSSGKIKSLNSQDFSDNMKTNCGAFVTLNKNHRLRGCIGRFDASEQLYQVVQQMAIASATQDSRFIPVTKDELPEIEIEISVLTPMKPIQSVDEIILGKHGIYIKKGKRSGTFLPQVATETGWTLEEFLGHCSRDKAGLGWDGWKDAEIFAFEALVFSESD